MQRLSEDEQQKKLKKLDVEWSLPGDESLHRVYTFEDFKGALAFVNKVGQLAEQENHHPQICFTWGKVEIVLRTHDVGGLTQKDFLLATKLDALGS